MFAEAFRLASLYTYPVIISRRYYDKSTSCGCAAFVVLNEDGWIVTAAHLLTAREALQRNAREIARYFGRIQAIQEDGKLSETEKRRRIFRLKANPKWVTQLAFWWGRDGVEAKDMRLLPEADLAVARLEPFDAGSFRCFPILKDPSRLSVGTSLCKFGFPFNRVGTSYDERRGMFRLRTGPLPLQGFPMDGIYTRTIPAGRTADGRYNVKFLETSTPGLVGQSGGPLFDHRGVIWGVQSRTDIRPLGVHAAGDAKNPALPEILSLNLGIAVHPEILVAYLQDNGIRFRLSES
jgi:hypothetical protein